MSGPKRARPNGSFIQSELLLTTASGPGCAAFDGIAELWLDSIDDMTAAFNEPQLIEKIAPNDEKFVRPAVTQLLTLHETMKYPLL
ncbi:MAG: EthD domain-containing protein [Gammaproteobacteria bacterium]